MSGTEGWKAMSRIANAVARVCISALVVAQHFVVCRLVAFDREGVTRRTEESSHKT